MNTDNVNYISPSTGTDSIFVNGTYCNSKYCNLSLFKHTNPHVINGPCRLMEGIKKQIECGWKSVRPSQPRWLRKKKIFLVWRWLWGEKPLKTGRTYSQDLGYFIFHIIIQGHADTCSTAHKIINTLWMMSGLIVLSDTLWEVNNICDHSVYKSC